MPFLKRDTKKEADALLRQLMDLKADILSYGLRSSFLNGLRERSEGLVNELWDRPDHDPHKAIAVMLRTASQGLREDEFNSDKIEALKQCLVVLGAAGIALEDVEKCRSMMLWAGLLGYGFSGGRRVTVDGKY